MRILSILSAAALCASTFGTAATAGPLPQPISDADFPTFDEEMVLLGRDLFFDPVLSGNKNIACATCHHPSLGTSDGMSLSIGEGGTGLGTKRRIVLDNKPKERIPRNAPALFNLGAREFSVMFHDGRVAVDRTAMYGIRMPEGRTLERPVMSPLAAQNILPVLSPNEMSGHPGENPVADAVAAERIHGPTGAWGILSARVDAIPTYNRRFAKLGVSEVHITDIANALSSFITTEFRATDSPFDRFLNGQNAMSEDALAGMDLFYGKARCSTCHAGAFQTDHDFYAIGLPQLGPGKNAHAAYADTGRGKVTGNPEDAYRFRTPTLRNVTQTAPYGHNGAYVDLEDMVRHHLDALKGLTSYDRSAARLSSDIVANDFEAMEDMEEVIRIAEAIEIPDVTLSDAQVAQIMAFLDALTDDTVVSKGLGAPRRVPSGLPLDPS